MDRSQATLAGKVLSCRLLVPEMAMIALATLVVIAQDANAIDDQGKAVLVAMDATGNRLRYLPDTLLDCDLAKHQLSVPNTSGFNPIAL